MRPTERLERSAPSLSFPESLSEEKESESGRERKRRQALGSFRLPKYKLDQFSNIFFRSASLETKIPSYGHCRHPGAKTSPTEDRFLQPETIVSISNSISMCAN